MLSRTTRQINGEHLRNTAASQQESSSSRAKQPGASVLLQFSRFFGFPDGTARSCECERGFLVARGPDDLCNSVELRLQTERAGIDRRDPLTPSAALWTEDGGMNGRTDGCSVSLSTPAFAVPQPYATTVRSQRRQTRSRLRCEGSLRSQ